MPGPMLTAREVADSLGLSPETVLRWARTGKLPSVRLSNRAIRFPQAAIDRWVAERATPGQEAPATPPGIARAGAYPLASVLPAIPIEDRK